MPRAVWNGQTIAKSDETIVVEGNHYFPPDSVDMQFFADSPRQTTGPWKGRASYYDVVVGDEVNAGAAWYYPHPTRAAEQIEGYVAFWRGVRVED
jgi:uncharacterized protein (DUF427 family)